MNSDQPNEPSKQLSLWDEFVEKSQNIQRDDSTRASIEKSALDDNHALMEEIVDETIIEMAWARVKANRGAPGPDGITLDEFPEWFRPQWETVRQQLLDGTYRPEPVRRVSIDKPGGGTRELGIPNLLDRVIQTAIVLVLTPIFDPEFSESSFGYRPYRSAQDAVKQVQTIIRGGRRWCVDMDLSKFFDRVQHDVLMSRVARKVRDKRLLKLIGRYLRAGVMVDGLCQPSTEGTMQGGPLSPLLSNIYLDDLDKELEETWAAICALRGRLCDFHKDGRGRTTRVHEYRAFPARTPEVGRQSRQELHSENGWAGVRGLRVSWLWRSDPGEQEEARCVQEACLGDLSQKPRRVHEIALREVPCLRIRLDRLLCVGSGQDNIRELGQVATAACPSLLLEAVAEVENSTEAADVLGCVLSCRSRIRNERQGPLASFHDVRSSASFIQRVPGRRGLV